MTGIQEFDHGVGIVAAIGFGAGRDEENIVLAPDRERRRFRIAEIGLKFRVERNVARIIEKQIQLNFIIAGAPEQRKIERLESGN